MNHRVISVTFEIDVQSYTDGRFTVPIEVCEILGGLKNGDLVNLVIQSTSGLQLFAGKKTLTSGREIYGTDIKAQIKAGQQIRVTVSNP